MPLVYRCPEALSHEGLSPGASGESSDALGAVPTSAEEGPQCEVGPLSPGGGAPRAVRAQVRSACQPACLGGAPWEERLQPLP